jgi:hypothetical protein
MAVRIRLVAPFIALVALFANACVSEVTSEAHEGAVAQSAQPLLTLLLFEGFDATLGQLMATGACSVVSQRGRCDDTASLTTTVSTVGMTAIEVSYSRLTDRYDAGEVFVAEYSVNGGATYTTLETLTGSAAWAQRTFLLPPSADNGSLRLRFRSNANGLYEWFEIDDVVVTGDSPGDRNCDGEDDDDDGRVDEAFVGQPASCGVGACVRTGQVVCVNGDEQDSCTPGTPAASDAICNGIDDDCDGEVDENGCPTPEIVIDNTAPSPAFTTSAAWTASTASPGWFGTNYAHGGNNDTFKTAKWTPDIRRSGAYQVYMWYAAASNRSANVPVTIQHDSGCTARTTLNQRVNGGRWNLLGTFDFSAESDGYVMIRGGGGGYTIADAVRFVRVGDTGPGGAGAECANPRCYQPGNPPAAQSCTPSESAQVTPRATTQSWQRVELPNTYCSDGSRYKFWVSFSNSSNNLLVMFEGGAACWSYETCNGEVVNQHGLPNDHIDRIVPDFPVLSRSTTTNPTRTWNYVVLPYCTGDLQGGDRDRLYNSDDGDFSELYLHRGRANMKQVTAWLDAQFPVVPRLMVTGCSAGGFSSIVSYDLLRRGMSGVQCGYMLDDSGAVFPSDGPSAVVHETVQTAWSLDTLFDEIGGPSCPADAATMKNDFGQLNLVLADRYARDRLATTYFQRDLVSRFSYQEFLNPQSFQELLAYFAEDTQALRAIYDTRSNLGYYLPYRRDLGCSHCTTFSTYTGTAIGTSTMQTYISALLNNGVALPRQFEGPSPDGDWTSAPPQCFVPSPP